MLLLSKIWRLNYNLTILLTYPDTFDLILLRPII
jgi:hypothetical protein